MSVKRRVFNGYLIGGLAVGSGAGYIAGRLSLEGTRSYSAIDLLRETAQESPGIHQLGLNINDKGIFSPENAEMTLLSRLGFDAQAEITKSDIHSALTELMRKDFANGNTLEVNKFILSDSEALFIRYALSLQQLEDTAYTMPKLEIRDGTLSNATNFGPKSTVVGQIFNEQADGHGGIWVQAENSPPGTVITVNDEPIKTRWRSTTLTGAVYDEHLAALIARPAKHVIAIQNTSLGLRQVLGHLVVKPRPPAAILDDETPSTVFCEIDQWRIQDAKGLERIRVKTLCAPRSAAVYVGDTSLTTKIYNDRLDATLDRSVFAAGNYQVRLVDPVSNESVNLGYLDIEK